MASTPPLFRKPPKTLEEQVQILIDRGVVITDFPKACSVLGRLNYYRFCGYGLYFEEFSTEGVRLDRFKPGTTFERILQLYQWDESLRHLLRDALGWVEISFRTAFIYEMANQTQDPYWHLDAQWMQGPFDVRQFENECISAAKESTEVFTKHFQSKYQSDLTPCWILAEILSFGKWSRLLGCLKHKEHIKKVASRLGAPPNDLVSWIRALVVLRNRCAHHGRLWDYSFKMRPSLTPTLQRLGWPPDRLGVMIWIIADLLRKDSRQREAFISRLQVLLAACPEPYSWALGLTDFDRVMK